MATTSTSPSHTLPPVTALPLGDPGTASTTPAEHPSLRDQIPTALIDRLLSCVLATGGHTETTRAPFTGEELLTYPISTEADVEEAFARARVAQRQWAARPVAERPGSSAGSITRRSPARTS